MVLMDAPSRAGGKTWSFLHSSRKRIMESETKMQKQTGRNPIESASSPFRSWSSRNVVPPFPVATSGYRSRFSVSISSLSALCDATLFYFSTFFLEEKMHSFE